MTLQQIFITGASSGIGAALAELYARQHGAALTLGLVARRGERLAALADRLRGLGARVLCYPADVRERERMAEVARAFASAAGGVTLAIANAGLSRPDDLPAGDAAAAAEVVTINVAGVLHTLMPLLPTLIAQGSGHVVAIGSVAGFLGLPGKGAYCASKAALKTMMDAFRPALSPYGIHVTTICPGWVVSEMTARNDYAMPFLMDTPKAARLIARAIARGRATYVFPWQMRLALPLIKALPERLLPTLAARS